MESLAGIPRCLRGVNGVSVTVVPGSWPRMLRNQRLVASLQLRASCHISKRGSLRSHLPREGGSETLAILVAHLANRRGTGCPRVRSREVTFRPQFCQSHLESRFHAKEIS